MRKFVLSVVLLLSLALFGACGAAPAQTPSASATPFPTPTPSPTATVTPTPSPSPTPTVIPTPSPSPSPSEKAPAATKKPAATPKPTPKVAPKPTPSKEVSGTVYIGETGTKYHQQSCPSLKGNGRAISRAEAIRQGRGPCKVCKPG